ncbi:hypothetical protein MF271_04870 [Deinococcus sp. KNUC1210]|uniref:hypothetical protein n=1 Tax=Deinococcus sp. KNUC1210 TaxID=2917691 RepID=UPI001EEFACCA|nr:hypothetical protein [Deinococcus sp. KNUC1210]ULH15967.1 hypothetical protein MF271_04870 [Deinococcus sp. KNUC1210]
MRSHVFVRLLFPVLALASCAPAVSGTAGKPVSLGGFTGTWEGYVNRWDSGRQLAYTLTITSSSDSAGIAGEVSYTKCTAKIRVQSLSATILNATESNTTGTCLGGPFTLVLNQDGTRLNYSGFQGSDGYTTNAPNATGTLIKK